MASPEPDGNENFDELVNNVVAITGGALDPKVAGAALRANKNNADAVINQFFEVGEAKVRLPISGVGALLI